ncbi:hypothetical protein AM1_1595 [Acaryochloris marina MBIC11017]|uniref:Uncharacterized protein n=1 Tax=Acaryochloris marina (strain MBIC 11017) TaxID=329726 RepID=B0CA32_ACAM1|nr:hypothetical protein AM1_1595 [Acaryochloris marina MBIC11017]
MRLTHHPELPLSFDPSCELGLFFSPSLPSLNPPHDEIKQQRTEQLDQEPTKCLFLSFRQT